MFASLFVLLFALSFLLSSCGIFTPRTPETPVGTSGTWLQPDTPDRVMENIKNAIAEKNVQNYVRSLASNLTFQPTLEAQAKQSVIWTRWTTTEEEAYFSRLQSASTTFSGHSLQLLDITQTIIDNTHNQVQASYILRLPHSRTDEGIATEFRGRLVWIMAQGSDGLWRLHQWLDQSTEGKPSWSDLKAAFVK
jgi:hypothetical protein